MTDNRLARRTSRLALATAALTAAVPALADTVQNPGFETGNTNGWTASGGIWSSGSWPPLESEYSGPPTLLTVTNAGQTDAITGAPTVFAGSHAVRLNDRFGGNNITALTQTVNSYTGNKLYYAWNAVLEPSHGATDSPSFIIKVTDETTGQVVTNIAYSAFTAQNSTIFRSVNGFVTTDWKVEDIDTVAGNNYKLVFVAVDCLYGGHGGYVYVDGFGDSIPVPNVGVTFNPATDVVRGASFLLPIGGTSSIDTTKPFWTTTELLAGLVNPSFTGGTLRIVGSSPISRDFNISSAGGTIDTDGNNVAFTGQFTGAGGLIKTGLGMLTLSGINTFNGRVTVSQGTLAVTGALSVAGVDINSGAILSGIGPIVAPINVNAGGTLAPGAQIGVMNVAGGNVTMAGTARLALDIDGRVFNALGGAGSYDRLALTGGSSVFIANGVVAPNLRGIAGGNNNFTPVYGDTFLVVTADSVTGAFASVAQPASGLGPNSRFDVRYGAKTVELVVTPASYATLGGSDGWKLNAVNAAAGIDAVRPAPGPRINVLPALFDGLYGLDREQISTAFHQLSGEIHAHALQVAQRSARDVSGLAIDAAQDAWNCSPRGSTKAAGSRDENDACTSEGRRRGVVAWGQALTSTTQASADPAAGRYQASVDGLVMGVNLIDNGTTRIGIGGRYSEGTIAASFGSSADVDGGSVFAYGAHRFGPLSVGLAGGWHTAKVKATRALTLRTGTSIASSAYKVDSITGSLEMRLDLPVSRAIMVRPVIGVDYAHNRADAVSESSTSPTLALNVGAENWDTMQSRAGGEAKIALGAGLQFNAHADWRYELKNNATATRAVSLAPASWSVSSVVADRSSVQFGAGISAAIAPGAKIRVDYAGERSGSYKVNRGSVGLAVAF